MTALQSQQARSPPVFTHGRQVDARKERSSHSQWLKAQEALGTASLCLEAGGGGHCPAGRSLEPLHLRDARSPWLAAAPPVNHGPGLEPCLPPWGSYAGRGLPSDPTRPAFH